MQGIRLEEPGLVSLLSSDIEASYCYFHARKLELSRIDKKYEGN